MWFRWQYPSLRVTVFVGTRLIHNSFSCILHFLIKTLLFECSKKLSNLRSFSLHFLKNYVTKIIQRRQKYAIVMSPRGSVTVGKNLIFRPSHVTEISYTIPVRCARINISDTSNLSNMVNRKERLYTELRDSVQCAKILLGWSEIFA